MLSILRELVEMLFSRGYIKVLFATETFAVGINMPTKTVIFSSLFKFDGNQNRMLKPHEYLQMAGRAGRRGIDSEGHIIHCNSLFEPPANVEYKYMLTGPSQSISSKFQVSYNFILNILSSNKLSTNNISQFIGKTLLNTDIEIDIKYYEKIIDKVNSKIIKQNEIIDTLDTPRKIMQEFIDLQDDLSSAKNKKRKLLQKNIDKLQIDYPSIDKDINIYKTLLLLKHDLEVNDICLKKAYTYIDNGIEKMTNMLQNLNFIYTEDDTFFLTNHGLFASQIMETNGLVISTIISKNNLLDSLYPAEIHFHVILLYRYFYSR